MFIWNSGVHNKINHKTDDTDEVINENKKENNLGKEWIRDFKSSIIMKLFIIAMAVLLFLFVMSVIAAIWFSPKHNRNTKHKNKRVLHFDEKLGFLDEEEKKFKDENPFNLAEFVYQDGSPPILKRQIEIADLSRPNPVSRWMFEDINELFLRKIKLLMTVQPYENGSYPEDDVQQRLMKKLFEKTTFHFDTENPVHGFIPMKEEIKMLPNSKGHILPEYCQGRVDVVWLYVNGSEPHWQETIQRYKTDFDPQRFRDYDALKFSIRSVYLNAPFIHNFFLVVSDSYQIPTFLNRSKIHTIDEFDKFDK
ncbi:hypothetical protein EDI_108780, partial [Entamoeba dispar SAW760]